jgi:uncharacterized lipoprotein YehR (DUF1307 family)
MKNILKLTLGVLLVSLSLTSCSKSDDIAEGNKNEIVSFSEKNVSGQSNRTDNSVIEFSDIKTANEDYNTIMNGLEITVDLNNKTATVIKEGETGSIIYDLVESKTGFLSFQEKVQKTGSQARLPRWLCGAGCALGGFAISMSDGPAPFADMYAIGFTINCASGC